jgi:hypothetical protein
VQFFKYTRLKSKRYDADNNVVGYNENHDNVSTDAEVEGKNDNTDFKEKHILSADATDATMDVHYIEKVEGDDETDNAVNTDATMDVHDGGVGVGERDNTISTDTTMHVYDEGKVDGDDEIVNTINADIAMDAHDDVNDDEINNLLEGSGPGHTTMNNKNNDPIAATFDSTGHGDSEIICESDNEVHIVNVMAELPKLHQDQLFRIPRDSLIIEKVVTMKVSIVKNLSLILVFDYRFREMVTACIVRLRWGWA